MTETALKTRTAKAAPPKPAPARKAAAVKPASSPAPKPATGLLKATGVGDKTVHRIPLNQLVEWPRNPRQAPDKGVVEGIANSLIGEDGRHKGLITPISVFIQEPGLLAYTVYIGSQRHGAYKLNALNGKTAGDVLVDCFIDDVDEDTAYVRAVLENVARGPMHEIDQAEAMLRMANQHMNVSTIANSVGMSKKAVYACIDVARLDDRSKRLIRSNKRPFAWAHVLSGADAPFRNRILDDIDASPTAWNTVEQLRSGMKMTRVAASHAIFDLDAAKIQRSKDMLDDTEWVSDREAFWEHQNAAVERARDQLEREGHDKVEILRGQCHDEHSYRSDDTLTAGKSAFIEVSSDGQVRIVRDLVKVDDDDGLFDAGAAEATVAEAAGESITTIAPKGKAAKILVDAVGDAAVASIGRDDALRVLVAALIEDDEIRIAGTNGRTPSQIRIRENVIAEALGKLPERGEKVDLDDLPKDEAELLDLLHKLTLTALAPCRSRGTPFEKADETSLLRRALSADPAALRRSWTPNREFLESLETRDLRTLGLELLSAEGDFVPEAMSKSQVVTHLEDAFRAVAEGRSALLPETQAVLANWRPEYLI